MDIKELYNIYQGNPEKFKKIVLYRNLLGSPVSYNYKDSDLESLVQMIMSMDEKYETDFGFMMMELGLAYEAIYSNMKNNNAAREKTEFMNYPLDYQLRALISFFEAQHKLGIELNNIDGKKPITGIKHLVANVESEIYPGMRYSTSQNSENLIELIDYSIPYLYYYDSNFEKPCDNLTYEQCLQCPDIMKFVHHSNFCELINGLWSLYIYKDYSVKLGKTDTDDDITVFVPNSNEASLIDFVAGIRREARRFQNSIDLLISNQNRIINGNKFIIRLAKKIKLDLWKSIFELELEVYLRCNLSANCTMKIIKQTDIFPAYLRQTLPYGELNDFLEVHEFLVTMSEIYSNILNHNWEEIEHDRFNYLCPVVDIDLLIKSFSRLYGKSLNTAAKLVEWFIYYPQRGKEGDLFSKPLVQISGKRVLFAPNLIRQINITRMLEQIMLDYKIKRAAIGDEYESYLRNKLSQSSLWNVYADKIEFKSSIGNTDFDVIALFDNHVVIIEIKHLVTPYDPKRYYEDRQEIKKAIKQLKLRKQVLLRDWALIRDITNGFLPPEPYPEERIIQLVCTNIDSFTSLEIDGIRIVDESVLIRFFSDNGQYVKIWSGSKIYKKEKIWENSQPTIDDFKRYIASPTAVKWYREVVKRKNITIPRYGEGEYLGTVNYILDEDIVKFDRQI